jgi:DNA-binding transcriptional MerR regulator
MSAPWTATFSTNDVVKVARVSERQLQWWDEQRIVTPAHAGHRREYSVLQTLQAMIVAEWRVKGIRLRAIRKLLRQLPLALPTESHDPMEARQVILVINGRAYVVSPEAAVEQASEAPGPIYMVDLTALIVILRRGTRSTGIKLPSSILRRAS